MRVLLTTFITLLAISTNASELKSTKLREMVCQEIAKSSYSLQKKNCLEGNIKIADVENFQYQGKSYNIILNVETYFLGSKFDVELKRDFTIEADKVVLKAWSAKLIDSVLGDYHILAATHDSSSNIKEITSKPDLAKLPSGTIAWEGLMASSYSSKEDYVYYSVFNKENKLIGYLAYVWYENEEDDIKGYETQSFNLSGDQVGSGNAESWNYHE